MIFQFEPSSFLPGCQPVSMVVLMAARHWGVIHIPSQTPIKEGFKVFGEVAIGCQRVNPETWHKQWDAQYLSAKFEKRGRG